MILKFFVKLKCLGENWDLRDCDQPCLDGTLHAIGCYGIPLILTLVNYYWFDNTT